MKDKAEIVCILDRSGSMQSFINDAIGGYNAFLADQKKIDKPADLTVVQFDNEYTVPYQGTLQDAPDMTRESYVPRGSTALLDAIGRTINNTGNKLRGMSEAERPDRVLVVIITDGQENSSQEFDLKKINEMISHQRGKYNWEFIFLAAGQDAMAEAVKMGINPQFAINYMARGPSAKGAYQVMSSAIGASRTGSDVDVRYRLSDALCCDVDENGEAVKREVVVPTSGPAAGRKVVVTRNPS